MINITGFLATLFGSLTSPSQVVNVIKNRKNAEILDGVSAWSIFIIMANYAVWAIYGLSFDAIWTSAIAMVSIIVYAIISIVIGVYGGRKSVPLIAIVSLVAFTFISYFLSQVQMGVLGSTLASMMFAPQAMKIYQMRGTPGVYGYSLTSSILIILSAVMWIWYAFLLKDVWVGFYSPFAIAAGIAMIVVRLQGVDDEKA